MPPNLDNYELTWYMQEICMHGAGAEIEYTEFQRKVDDEIGMVSLSRFSLACGNDFEAGISDF